MRRYGLYDVTRGLTIALSAGLAGLLLYLATRVGMQSTARFWASLGIVAAAGLVLALAPVLGGWTKGLRLRFSRGTFLLGFVPVLVAVGWILMATQPGNGWHEGTIASWSESLGLMGIVHALGLWHGALALGVGVVLGTTLDAVPVPVQAPVAAPAAADDEVARGPVWRREPATDTVADEPLTAEREAAVDAEPHLVTVGPRSERETETVD
jgi:hypothetical protein